MNMGTIRIKYTNNQEITKYISGLRSQVREKFRTLSFNPKFLIKKGVVELQFENEGVYTYVLGDVEKSGYEFMK